MDYCSNDRLAKYMQRNNKVKKQFGKANKNIDILHLQDGWF